MDKFVLEATSRKIIGKKVKLLKKDGIFPGVIYGKSLDNSVPISLDLNITTKALRSAGESTIISLMVDKEEYTVLIRDVQFDVLLGTYIHIDFLAVSQDEKVSTNVSLFVEGIAPAVNTFNAMIISGISQIEVEALPKDLPASFTIDISVIENIGDGIFVKDLTVSDKVSILTNLDEMIVVATAPTLIEEEEEELDELDEELGEPEVIEKGSREEESEE